MRENPDLRWTTFEEEPIVNQIEEIVQEFTRKRFPSKRERERMKKKIVPAADNLEFAQEFNGMIEEFAKMERRETELTEEDIP